MAIEHEIKYVLKASAFVEACMRGCDPARLEQHYLTDECRIRRTTTQAGTEAVFTFKRMTDQGLVEIETDIADADYERLLPTATHGLIKHRTSFDVDDEHWDIDLFEAPNGRFVLAEVEMPDDRDKPNHLPSFVAAHLVLEAGKDKAWANANLSKPGNLEKAVAYVAAR